MLARSIYNSYKANKQLRSEINRENQIQVAERTSSLPQGGRISQQISDDNISYRSDAPPTYEELMNAENTTENFDFPVEL